MESWGHSANFWADRHIDDNLIRPHLEAAFSLTCRQFSPLFCHQWIEDQIGDDPILASTLVHTHQLGGSQWLGGAKRYQTYIQYVPTSKQEIYQLIRSVYRSSSQAKFSVHSLPDAITVVLSDASLQFGSNLISTCTVYKNAPKVHSTQKRHTIISAHCWNQDKAHIISFDWQAIFEGNQWRI